MIDLTVFVAFLMATTVVIAMGVWLLLVLAKLIEVIMEKVEKL